MLRVRTPDPPNAEAPLAALDEPITPVGSFYVRCNFAVPRDPDGDGWRVELDGAVEAPRAVTLDELRAGPVVEAAITLECAGNGRALMRPVPDGTPWALGAVGTARFTGTPLAPLLAALRPRDDVVAFVFTGADRGRVEPEGELAYAFDLDRADALGDGPLLAWSMNGLPLTAEHGAPLRLVVPGHYGMRSVKWLTRITAVTAPFDGHFPRRYRFRDDAREPEGARVGPIRVRSLVTHPADGATLAAGTHEVRGVAWSGAGPIARVELDDGDGWRSATLDPSPGPGAWRRWRVGWSASPGEHELAVRATDASGATQPEAAAWNAGGYANNVVHRVRVRVG